MVNIRVVAAVLALTVTSRVAAQGSSTQSPSPLAGLEYTTEFFPGAHYDAAVTTPESVLGFTLGSRPVTHAQIEAVIGALAATSRRCRLLEYGKTHEGRTLYYLIVGSEANLARLEALQADLAKLADPRQVSRSDGDRLAATLPAVAWMAYCIHGDEMSGSDAALAALYHLCASTDADVAFLLENLVVLVDPLMNPDGRDRFLSMLAQNRTAQPSVDDQSLLHTGFWPSGRMNHYLFDLNRDWIFATQPETRGRIPVVNAWNPHYFMESHEMGSQDTFLFMPGREAVNPNVPENVIRWETRFAEDLAAAFDTRGWRYYTGEWNDNWYPGYSSSWAAMRGAVENLYEQASIGTDAVRRAEGTLHSYREAVHKQLVATMTNLTTLAKNRKDVLADFVAEKRACTGGSATIPARTFAFPPSANAARQRQFLDLMMMQGFEVSTATAAFRASGTDRLGREVATRDFPVGTLLIAARQPLGRLVQAMLEFDPRMKPQVLADERRDLLRFGASRIYDITGWSIPMLFDLEAYTLDGDPPGTARAQPAAPAAFPPSLADSTTTVAFVVDGADDASVAVAGRLMERGVHVRIADKPFQFNGRDYVRGSVVVTRVDNSDFAGNLSAAIRDVCAQSKASAAPVRTGWGPGDLPDLGGQHFILLEPPRIAILGREPIGPYGFGQAWYVIDRVLGLRATYVDAHELGSADLRRYNVLVIPNGGATVVASKMEALRTWITAGGTLIANGGSAAAFAKEKDGIGATRLLPDVLGKLGDYQQAIVREWEGRRATLDTQGAWSFTPPPAVVYPWLIGEAGSKASEEELKRQDAWCSLFMPSGAILAGRADDRSWLTGGCANYVPLIYTGGNVLMAPPSVQAPVRLGVFNPATAPAKKAAKKADDKDGETAPGWTIAPPEHELRLRMSGLLWPEAANRLANAAYMTREGIGSGQLILFASEPNFRAAALGTMRIFANAVVYGPGMGASHPIEP